MPYNLIQSHIRLAQGMERMARAIRRKVAQQQLPDERLNDARYYENEAISHRNKATLFGAQFVMVTK